MRQIKFRVWKNKKMDYHPNLLFNSRVDLNEQIEELQYRFGNLMQFTGLKDKNGKEIYEGDIFYEKESHLPISEWGMYYVVYDNAKGAFLLQYQNHDERLRYEMNSLNIGKIIGNIHENPELLEKSNG